MKKTTILTLVLCLVLNIPVLAGLDGKKAAYQGGTTKDINFPGAKDPVEGNLNTSDAKALKFEYTWKKNHMIYAIPYNQVIDIEYGQKAGRRVGAAVATALLLSP